MTQPQSFLARHQPKAALSDGELLAMKARAWVDHGLLVVSPGDFTNLIDQEMVRSLGARIYGRCQT